MYKKITPSKTVISVNKTYKGETIEQKVHRILNNKEPIKDGAPKIYTERKDGVLPELDPRTDRWEEALTQMDKVAKTHVAKRQERADAQKTTTETTKGNEVKDQPAQGT